MRLIFVLCTGMHISSICRWINTWNWQTYTAIINSYSGKSSMGDYMNATVWNVDDKLYFLISVYQVYSNRGQICHNYRKQEHSKIWDIFVYTGHVASLFMEPSFRIKDLVSYHHQAFLQTPHSVFQIFHMLCRHLEQQFLYGLEQYVRHTIMYSSKI
jgi:hypothetical protein